MKNKEFVMDIFKNIEKHKGVNIFLDMHTIEKIKDLMETIGDDWLRKELLNKLAEVSNEFGESEFQEDTQTQEKS